MSLGIIKKFKLLFTYIKIILNNKSVLNESYKIRCDYIFRLYTIINIPTDLIPEAYDLKKSDIDKLSQSYVSDSMVNISSLLNKIGLIELYVVYDLKKVDKYSYLVVIGFKFLKLEKLFRNLLILITILLSTLIIYLNL